MTSTRTWFASSPRVSRPRRTGGACARRRPTSGTGARSASRLLAGLAPDERRVYSPPAELGRNQWALSGDWRIGLVPARLDEAGGSIRFRFHARDVHLVMGPPAGRPPVRFEVRLDGEPPGRAHGVNVDESGGGTADYQRMYQLIRQPAPIGDRLFEIEFLDAGVEAFVFTFG